MNGIERILAEELSNSGYAKLGKLSIFFDERGRIVTLRGRVSSYHLKQRAPEIARLVAGGSRIVNCVDVQPNRLNQNHAGLEDSDDESDPMRRVEG